ncbi:50S ribosomal protein L25 [Allorhodopirellula heiligendammensis]|uniref:Large ribosomal subunit protein bL25 n=1 Tax=Allorhodopirellula heiligendammensis TaxID=2714739 RepID=A0A5C6BV26_9BACT|nr:50S ribosomal protein L25 [Allorhodopirellula heiligendammensis]TWU15908.1 General stress protein CTC [Allorhodopirellula heiligendammensis]
MTDVIQATKRDSTGTAATTRLRREGNVPAVLYGHGEANEHLAISAVQVKGLLRHHSKTVTLTGDVNETALVSDMQWDPLGIEVLHLDLIRVNLQEKVEVTVAIETHGEAAGTREGGIFLENLREVDVRCSAGSIPESLVLDVNDLHLGDQATAADLQLPEGVELVTDPETVIAHVEAPRSEAAVEEEDAIGSEPEVISKGGGEEEDEA